MNFIRQIHTVNNVLYEFRYPRLFTEQFMNNFSLNKKKKRVFEITITTRNVRFNSK